VLSVVVLLASTDGARKCDLAIELLIGNIGNCELQIAKVLPAEQ
jgi:hypothetical protein